MKDVPRSGQSSTAEKIDEIIAMVEQDRHVSIHREYRQRSPENVSIYLKTAGYREKKKPNVWVSREMKRDYLHDHCSTGNIP